MDSYSEIITNQAGQAIEGASVLVQDSTGATATIFSDDGVTPASNPLTTDVNGRFTFFAASGRYTLVITATGFPSKTLKNIVLFDPSEASEKPFFISRLVKIPNDNYGKHKGFGVTDVLPSGRVVHVYREAEDHGSTPGNEGIIRVIYSDDNGRTWSVPQTIHTLPGEDLRNIGGGVTAAGTFIAMWEGVDPRDLTKSNGYVSTSTDGVTWSTPAQVWSRTLNLRLTPHGKIVETSVGVLQSVYDSTNDGLYLPKTNDEGQTWTLGSQVATAPGFTETSIVHVGNDRLIAVSRNENTAPEDTRQMNRPYVLSSTDGGATWSAVDTIDNIALGTNPPILWFDEGTNRVLLIFNKRNTPRGHWYMASIDADEFFNGESWRHPVALPLPSMPNLGTRLFGENSYTPAVTLVGGTDNVVPQYAAVRGKFYFAENGLCTVEVLLAGDGGNDGAGTGSLKISLPRAAHAENAEPFVPAGRYTNGASENLIVARALRGASVMDIAHLSGGAFANLTGADQSDTIRTIELQYTYRAVDSTEGPNFGGDGDYPHIFRTRAGLRMMYFAGGGFEPYGTDYWLANLDVVLGINE